jgi:YD repeat-containing protein
MILQAKRPPILFRAYSLQHRTYALDAKGQLTARTKWDGTRPVVTRYTRDVLGRITGVTDPKLNQWSYTYDQLGRRTQVNDPDLGTWSYAYDAASRLTTQTDAKGQVTTLEETGTLPFV